MHPTHWDPAAYAAAARRAEALSLLRSLAEDQLSRTL